MISIMRESHDPRFDPAALPGARCVRSPGILVTPGAPGRVSTPSSGDHWIGPITGIRINGANIAQRIAATICPHDSVR